MEKDREWRRLLTEQEKGGQGIAEFCRERGLRESTYQYWRAKLGKKAPSKFVKIGEAAKVELELSSGAVIRIPADIAAESLCTILEACGAVAK